MPGQRPGAKPTAVKSTLSHPANSKVWVTKDPVVLGQQRAMHVEALNVAPAVTVQPAVNHNKLLVHIDEGEPVDGHRRFRIRETFEGKPVPQGYQRHAMIELIDTTRALREHLADRAGGAFAEASQALSPHLRGRLDEVIPFLSRDEDEPAWLVVTSALPGGLKTFRLGDLPTREMRVNAHDNAKAIVRVAVKMGGELNGHHSNFLFDESGKVLQWSDPVIPRGPEHFKAALRGDGIEFRLR